MDNSSFVPNIGRLQAFDYESIVQALITRTDAIWLQALTLDVNNTRMRNSIEELMDAELIKLWDYEIPLSHSSRRIDRIITIEEHNEIEKCKMQLIEEMVRATDFSKYSDFTTLNIERKNIISSQLLAECCGSTSILQRYPGNFTNQFSGNGSSANDLVALYTPYLFGTTVMGNLSNLSIDDIMELRKLSKHFRSKIQEYASKHMFSIIPEAQIKKDCEEIHKEYESLVQEAVKEKYSLHSIGTGIVLEVLSVFVNWMSFFSIPQKAIDAILTRKERGFVLYMSKLSATANAQDSKLD
jgi:hypothetical protein